MADESMPVNDTTSMRRLKILLWLAVASLAIAVLAGLLLLITDPTPGSDSEAALGITAAISGLATGILVIASLVYAQVKNLWRYVPAGIRIVLWVLIAIGIVLTLWNQISQPFGD